MSIKNESPESTNVAKACIKRLELRRERVRDLGVRSGIQTGTGTLQTLTTSTHSRRSSV
jgi:hypothetical protein